MDPVAAWTLGFSMILFMKIVVFILGYLVVRLGYKLIASGAKGEFKFSGEFSGLKADLTSISPGLLFVLLGVLLIGYAVFVKKSVSLGPRPDINQNVSMPTDTTLN